ncbi:MAG: DUF5668 domain-containing protein [Patescibacteria group bacterium]
MFLGFLLMALGVVFLLQNLGILDSATWSIVWPILIIAFGLSIVFKKNRRLM